MWFSNSVCRERDVSTFTRVESSGFLAPVNETVTTKLISSTLHWEEKCSEVSVYCP